MAEKFTVERIAKLFDLQPWQRVLLDGMIRCDEAAKREKVSYIAEAEALYNRILRDLDSILVDYEGKRPLT